MPESTAPTNSDVDRGRLVAAWTFDDRRRDAELDDLVSLVAESGTPSIVAGDFNLSVGSRPTAAFRPIGTTPFSATGRGFGHTYPAPDHDHDDGDRGLLKVWFPLLWIDHVFTTGGLGPVRSWTEPVFESDHLAVLADVQLPAAR
jgi:endonuclease/exonuclease/phosphatase family metal-dependent hydrolase